MKSSTFTFIVLYFMCTCYCFPSQPAHIFILYLFSFSSSCLFIFFLCFLVHSTSVPITLHLSCPSLLSFSIPHPHPLVLLSILSILAPQERNAVIFLLLPKPPLENIGLIKVKGKGLKRKVFHASCEWYAGPENSKVPSLCFFFPPHSSFTM